jgi:four helix bundle protein
MHNFKELKIWQESMSLAKEVFSLTRNFPTTEKYGLISQLNRAVVSVPSNTAEGAGRDSQKEFNQFLNISLGSCFEIETQLILANDFNYISKEELQTLIEKVTKIQRMISKLKDSIKQLS